MKLFSVIDPLLFHFLFQIKSANIFQLEKLVLLKLCELNVTATLHSAIKLQIHTMSWGGWGGACL